MAEKIRVLLSEAEVMQKVEEIAAQINRDYEGRELTIIGILKGAVFFTCELAKESQCRLRWILCRYPVMEAEQNPAEK